MGPWLWGHGNQQGHDWLCHHAAFPGQSPWKPLEFMLLQRLQLCFYSLDTFCLFLNRHLGPLSKR